MADYGVQFMPVNIALSCCAEKFWIFVTGNNSTLVDELIISWYLHQDDRDSAQFGVSIVLNVRWVLVRGLVILRFYCYFTQTFETNVGHYRFLLHPSEFINH